MTDKIKYADVGTHDDVERWVEEHPEHPITAAWAGLLENERLYDDIFVMEDFYQEAEFAMYKYAGGMDPDEVIG